jgi:hypothetical protein
MPDDASAATRKIPLWRTVRDAHVALIRHAPAALRALALPLLLLLTITAALRAFGVLSDDLNSIAAVWTHAASWLLEELLIVAAAALVAVQWHRFLLLGEPPGWLPRTGMEVHGRYLIVAATTVLLLVLPIAAASIGMVYLGRYLIERMMEDLRRQVDQPNKAKDETAASPGAEPAPAVPAQPSTKPADTPQTAEPDADAADAVATDTPLGTDSDATFPGMLAIEFGELFLMSLPVIAIFIALSIVPMRLSLALPAIALGQLRQPVAQAWALSRGNFWRLFLGSLTPFVTALVLVAPILLAVETLSSFEADVAELPTDGEEVAIATPNEDAEAEPDWASLTIDALGYAFAPALKLVFGMVWIGFLSLAYRSLTARPTNLV